MLKNSLNILQCIFISANVISTFQDQQITFSLPEIRDRSISVSEGDLVQITANDWGTWKMCKNKCSQPEYIILADRSTNISLNITQTVSGTYEFMYQNDTKITFNLEFRVMVTLESPGYFQPTQDDFVQITMSVPCQSMQLNGHDFFKISSISLNYCVYNTKLRFSSIKSFHVGRYSSQNIEIFVFTMIKERLYLPVEYFENNRVFIVFPITTLFIYSNNTKLFPMNTDPGMDEIKDPKYSFNLYLDENDFIVVKSWNDRDIMLKTGNLSTVRVQLIPIFETHRIVFWPNELVVGSQVSFMCGTELKSVLFFNLYINNVLKNSSEFPGNLTSNITITNSMSEIAVRCEIFYAYFDRPIFNFTENSIPVWKNVFLNRSQLIYHEEMHSNFILNVEKAMEDLPHDPVIWFVNQLSVIPVKNMIRVENVKDVLTLHAKVDGTDAVNVEFFIIPSTLLLINDTSENTIYLPSGESSRIICKSPNPNVFNISWIDENGSRVSEAKGEMIFKREALKYNGMYRCVGFFSIKNYSISVSKRLNVTFYISSPGSDGLFEGDFLQAASAGDPFHQNYSWLLKVSDGIFKPLEKYNFNSHRDLIVNLRLEPTTYTMFSVETNTTWEFKVPGGNSRPDYIETGIEPKVYKIADTINLSCWTVKQYMQDVVTVFWMRRMDSPKRSEKSLRNFTKIENFVIKRASILSSDSYSCVAVVSRYMIVQYFKKDVQIEIKGYEPLESWKSIYKVRVFPNITVNLTCGIRTNVKNPIGVMWTDANDTKLESIIVRSEKYPLYTEIFYITEIKIEATSSNMYKCVIQGEKEEPIIMFTMLLAFEKPTINMSISKTRKEIMVHCRVIGYFAQVTLLDSSSNVLVNQLDDQKSNTDITLSYAVDNFISDDIYNCIVKQNTESGILTEAENIYSVAIYRSTGNIVGISLMLIAIFGLVLCGIWMIAIK